MGAREYLPTLGRWLSADTIVPSPEDPQSLNRYSYVEGHLLVATDPTGHDLVIVAGAGGDIVEEGGATAWTFWIAAYKGWAPNDAYEWAKRWDSATEKEMAAMEQEAGIKFISYDSRAGQPITSLGIQSLHNQLVGMTDVTLVGYSKGANLVENYIAAGHQGKLEGGSRANKFVLLKAPDGAFQNISAPFSEPSAPFGRDSNNSRVISSFAGRVVNIYGGKEDPIGSQGYLSGANGNRLDFATTQTGVGSASYKGTHGIPGYSTANWAFRSLDVTGDHSARTTVKDYWRTQR